MSKNMDDATERCTKEAAIFEESCQKCVKYVFIS